MPHSAGDGLIPVETRLEMLRIIIQRAREQIIETGRWEWVVSLGLKGNKYEPIMANGRPLYQDRLYDWLHSIPELQEEWAAFQSELGLTFKERIAANLPAAIDEMFDIVFDKGHRASDRVNAFNAILRTSQTLGIFDNPKEAAKPQTNNVIAFINQYTGTVKAQNAQAETVKDAKKGMVIDGQGGVITHENDSISLLPPPNTPSLPTQDALDPIIEGEMVFPEAA